MLLNEYQAWAKSTAIYPDEVNTAKFGVIYCTLKLNGEAGEVAEKVGKLFRDKSGAFSADDIKSIASELGDVLWYLANLSNDLGYDLQEIAEMNREKLESRKARAMLQGSGDNR